jgi:1,4-dihydroxy-2-naphthoate octaprenyltransferase
MPILYIGTLAFIFTAFYSEFKYRAMGEIVSLVTYGPLIRLGTFYAMTSTLSEVV